MFRSVGPIELIIVLAIVVFIIGPKRLPGLRRQLVAGMREFTESISGDDGDEDDVSRPAGDDGGGAQAVAALGRPGSPDAPLQRGAATERAGR